MFNLKLALRKKRTIKLLSQGLCSFCKERLIYYQKKLWNFTRD